MTRDARERLADPQLAARLAPGEDWPRALFGANSIPDAWMGLLLRSDGRQRYCPAGEDPRAERGDRLLLVRNRALTLPFEVADTPDSAGHSVTVRGQAMLRWPARESDLLALAAWLPGDQTLSLALLGERFLADGASETVRRFVAGRPAEELVGSDQREALLAALRSGMQRFLFESGALLERVATLEFESADLLRRQARARDQSERLQALEARRALEAAATQAMRQRIDGLSGVLDKLKSATAAGGDTSVRELLPALSPVERARLLENLWRITPNRRTTTAVAVIAGQECLWFAPHAGDGQPLRRVTLPDDLGGLRSISADGDDLLIGAAQGVWRMDAATGELRAKYVVPGAEPQRTGFNAALTWSGRVYATHSALGCWSWALQSPGDAACVFAPRDGRPRGIRALTRTPAGVPAFAADECVHVLRPAPVRAEPSNDGPNQSDGAGGFSDRGAAPAVTGSGVPQVPPMEAPPATDVLFRAAQAIHALVFDRGALYAGTADGALLRVELDPAGGPAATGRAAAVTILHRSREALESISLRRWFDLAEVVLAAGADGVVSLYGDDGVLVRLMSAGVPLRRVWAADDLLVALSDTRDRLLLLPADVATPLEVPVSRMTGRSIQDAAVLSGSPADSISG